MSCQARTLIIDLAHQAQLIARDSKGIPTEAALQAANMVGINCYTNVCQQDNYQKNAPIMGFLGPGSPDAVAKVQRLLQLPHVDIAQMVYSSSSSSSPVLINTGCPYPLIVWYNAFSHIALFLWIYGLILLPQLQKSFRF